MRGQIGELAADQVRPWVPGAGCCIELQRHGSCGGRGWRVEKPSSCVGKTLGKVA